MQWTVDRSERFDVFLARMVPEQSRTRLARAIEEGRATVDGRVRKPSFRLEPGMTVEYLGPVADPPLSLEPVAVPLRVLWEDEHLLVVDKPRGLATHPAPSLREPTLVHALLARGQTLSEAAGAFRPGIVHRLDKPTTGCLLVAKNDFVHRRLQDQIQRRDAVRLYLAVVGKPPPREGLRIDAPIGRDRHHRVRMAINPAGRPATTLVRMLGRLDRGWLVLCRLLTGRTHQIRVHLAGVGLPVLGDELYAPRDWRDVPLQLHAWRLEFSHPVSGERIAVEAPLPDDFLAREESLATFLGEGEGAEESVN